jgi:hypothetical protein
MEANEDMSLTSQAYPIYDAFIKEEMAFNTLKIHVPANSSEQMMKE